MPSRTRDQFAYAPGAVPYLPGQQALTDFLAREFRNVRQAQIDQQTSRIQTAHRLVPYGETAQSATVDLRPLYAQSKRYNGVDLDIWLEGRTGIGADTFLLMHDAVDLAEARRSWDYVVTAHGVADATEVTALDAIQLTGTNHTDTRGQLNFRWVEEPPGGEGEERLWSCNFAGSLVRFNTVGGVQQHAQFDGWSTLAALRPGPPAFVTLDGSTSGRWSGGSRMIVQARVYNAPRQTAD